LTENIESKILSAIENKQFAYVEAEYHGGQGGQMAIIWRDHKRYQLLTFDHGRINEVLKYFGVIANMPQDEFLTVGLGLHRDTIEWINKPQ